jgi:hypothetical protein
VTIRWSVTIGTSAEARHQVGGHGRHDQEEGRARDPDPFGQPSWTRPRTTTRGGDEEHRRGENGDQIVHRLLTGQADGCRPDFPAHLGELRPTRHTGAVDDVLRRCWSPLGVLVVLGWP